MSYQPCVRGTLKTKMSFRDNLVTGTIIIDGKEYPYRTRKHIAGATNKIYADVPWKPQEGDEIIFDGDVAANSVIIDHIEPWRPKDYQSLDRHQDIQKRIIEKIEGRPPMDKIMRYKVHDDEGIKINVLRWQSPLQFNNGKKIIPCILNAIIAENEIRFCARSVSGAKPLNVNQTVILKHLCETAGIPKIEFEKKNISSKTKNPNKWDPNKAYRPEDMPEPFVDEQKPYLNAHKQKEEYHNEIDEFDDFYFWGEEHQKERKPEPGPVYDDVPF